MKLKDMVPGAILEVDQILDEVGNHANSYHMPGVHFAPVR